MTTCPNCASPADAGATFCEVCGLEFASGMLPEAPPPPKPVEAPPIKPSGGEPASAEAPAGGIDDSGWVVVIEPDREFFETTHTESPDVTIVFPDGVAAVEIPLRGPEVLLGRRIDEENVHPDLDLGADPGVSRRHAVLRRRIDGGWDLVDLGSTNGTRMGDAADPVTAHEPVALGDGDALHLGAWTRVTIRRTSALS